MDFLYLYYKLGKFENYIDNTRLISRVINRTKKFIEEFIKNYNEFIDVFPNTELLEETIINNQIDKLIKKVRKKYLIEIEFINFLENINEKFNLFNNKIIDLDTKYRELDENELEIEIDIIKRNLIDFIFIDYIIQIILCTIKNIEIPLQEFIDLKLNELFV